jgi:hypothetical protein
MKKVRISPNRWQSVGLLYVIVLLAQCVAPMLLGHANAASMSTTIVRFDRLKQSTGGAGDVFTSGVVCAKSPTAATATETSVKVTFPTGFTVSTTVGNWTVDTTNTTGWPTGGTAWTGIAAPTGAGEFVISGQSVNFQSGNLASASTLYCFNWTNTSAALKTPTSTGNDLTGQVITQTTGGVASDTGKYATSIVANDQIAVTASVNASFTFSLSSNAASLSTLSTGSPTESSAINASVSTNASQGWQMWAADPSGAPGLHSTTASKTIVYSPAVNAAASALTTGVEGYNLGSRSISGTTCGTPTYGNFNSATQYAGSGLDNTLRSLVSVTGPANACALALRVNASISATTPAATDYAGTITVVAAGSF